MWLVATILNNAALKAPNENNFLQVEHVLKNLIFDIFLQCNVRVIIWKVISFVF